MNENLIICLNAIKHIVGDENVVDEEQKVFELSKDIIPSTEKSLAFVYPTDLSQLQNILSLANQYKIPVCPVSQGKNWGYGGKSPYQKGSIVLVLRHLNKIIEINVDLAYAVVEPGVTFRQLHNYLVENKIPLWIDCTDGPADGSVVGNSLERGIGETDYGDHFGNICGLEVMLPDGKMIRTGGGPINNFRSWNTYKWGLGPYIEGLFSQSNFGIVTKMGLWLRPIPEAFVSCIFELHHKEDFPLLINAIRKLQLDSLLVSKIHLINDVATKAVAIEDFMNPELTLDGYSYSSWSFAAGVYGRKNHVKVAQCEIRKVLSPLGRVEFIDQKKIKVIVGLTNVLKKWQKNRILKRISQFFCKKIIGKPFTLLEILPHVHSIEKGYPSDFFVRHAYLKSKTPKPKEGSVNPVRDNCGLIWLGPMVPMLGLEVDHFLKTVEPLFKKYGFEMYVALMVGNARTAIVLLSIFYDKTNATETHNASALYYEIGALTEKMGYQQYRTSTMYMDRIFSGAPEYKEFCQKLKNVIDPNGIMAPGKYGLK